MIKQDLREEAAQPGDVCPINPVRGVLRSPAWHKSAIKRFPVHS